MASDILGGSKVKVGSVAGFPLGAETTKIKLAQAENVIFDGADEVDMVADIASIIQHDRNYLFGELSSMRKLCHSMKPKVVLKVIIEAPALTDEQKVFACKVAEEAGVDFVKTSTGFHKAGGATVKDVELIAQNVTACKIKASGGIRDAKQTLDLIKAGADRIGTSASIHIIEQFRGGLAQK